MLVTEAQVTFNIGFRLIYATHFAPTCTLPLDGGARRGLLPAHLRLGCWLGLRANARPIARPSRAIQSDFSPGYTQSVPFHVQGYLNHNVFCSWFT